MLPAAIALLALLPGLGADPADPVGTVDDLGLGDLEDTSSVKTVDATADCPICTAGDAVVALDDAAERTSGMALPLEALDPQKADSSHDTSTLRISEETATGLSVAPALLAILALLRRFAWSLWLPMVGLFSRIKDDKVLDHQTRSRIMDAITATPGASMQDLRRRVGLSHGTAVYHLGLLEQRGLLVSVPDGTARRYWPQDHPQARHRQELVALRDPSDQRIARFILETPGVDQTELCRSMGLRRPAASKRLSRLAKRGLVDTERRSRRCHYHPGDRLARRLADAEGMWPDEVQSMHTNSTGTPASAATPLWP